MDLNRYRKALGAVLGAVTSAGVVWLLGTVGVVVDAAAATAIAGALTALGTLLAPKNEYPE